MKQIDISSWEEIKKQYNNILDFIVFCKENNIIIPSIYPNEDHISFLFYVPVDENLNLCFQFEAHYYFNGDRQFYFHDYSRWHAEDPEPEDDHDKIYFYIEENGKVEKGCGQDEELAKVGPFFLLRKYFKGNNNYAK